MARQPPSKDAAQSEWTAQTERAGDTSPPPPSAARPTPRPSSRERGRNATTDPSPSQLSTEELRSIHVQLSHIGTTTPRAEAPSPPAPAIDSATTEPEAHAPSDSSPAGSSPAMAPVTPRRLSVTARSAQSPVSSPQAMASPATGNTTLRSLSRPVTPAGNHWDERRVMHLEREVDQLVAVQKLLKKRLAQAEFRIRLALFAAVALGALAVLGALL